VPVATKADVSRNLNGQKLGRKGRVTRERILAAAAELLEDPDSGPISLSAVARKASLGMTSLYLYFTDLTELLLAVLEPVMETAEQAYVGLMRSHWPDEELGERCREFMRAYFAFWYKHSRILHLRNTMSADQDQRMLRFRVASAQPVIDLLVMQMEDEQGRADSPVYAMASVLMTAIERGATVRTDLAMPGIMQEGVFYGEDRFILPAARLLELGIRDQRQEKGKA